MVDFHNRELTVHDLDSDSGELKGFSTLIVEVTESADGGEDFQSI